MKKARVRYVNDDNEGYAIEILSDGEWGLDTFYPLTKRIDAGADEEKNFVHFSIINKISELYKLGYKTSFC